MSASAWLMEAIKASKLISDTTVPTPEKYPWVQDNHSHSPIHTSFVEVVPIIPDVPNKISSVIDQLEVGNEKRESRRAKVLELLKGKQFAVLVEDTRLIPL